jgi:hypothetical protein
MPNKIKHSRETREKVYDLYWEGREPVNGLRGSGGLYKASGKYTLKQIEDMTGVPASTASKIARGVQ